MSRLNRGTVIAAAAALVALVFATGAAAGAGLKAKGRGPANVFSLSAKYTGYLSETITVNGVRYPVDPAATIYVVGQGVVPQGMMVYNRSIYLAGERKGKSMLVKSIVVRPMEGESRNSGGGRPDVGKVTDRNPPM